MGLPIIGANPVDTAYLYDSIILAGVQSPGVCSFPTPPKRVTGWDQQVPPGGGGGGFTLKRKEPPISFTLKLYLWKGDDGNGADVDHFALWEKFRPLLTKPIKLSDPKALDIYHPLLAGLQPAVTSVVVGTWCEPAPDGVGGAWVEILFDEFRPYRPRPVAQLVGTSTAKSDPNADLKLKNAYRAYVASHPSATINNALSFDAWVAAGQPQTSGNGIP